MEAVREGMGGSGNLFLCLCIIAAILIVRCDSRKTMSVSKDPNTIISNHLKNVKTFKRLDADPTLLDTSTSPPSSNAQPYSNSPFTLPPFDPLSSTSLSDSSSNSYCLNPPLTPLQTLPTPSSSIPVAPTTTTPPSPSIPTLNPTPPESSSVPTPTTPSQSPPGSQPGPPGSQPGPPGSEPSPPSQGSYPPNVPSPPTEFEPSPPLFLPPVVYPPPTASPPSGGGGGGGTTSGALWCVAKPSVPDPIIQEAMNYACGSGAECGDIQQSGKCFQPDTLFAHASFAFNSYWQRTKVAGGTCDFGGTAMLVTVDPSYDGCHFIYA